MMTEKYCLISSRAPKSINKKYMAVKNKKDKSCTSHRLLNVFLHKESVANKLSKYLHVDIYMHLFRLFERSCTHVSFIIFNAV